MKISVINELMIGQVKARPGKVQWQYTMSLLSNIPRSHLTSGFHSQCWKCYIDTYPRYSVRLSEIFRHKAALLEHIIADKRYPQYFRVAFYGSSLPVVIRNKLFVVRNNEALPLIFLMRLVQYRGFEWEKLGAFCERMLSKHPGSQLLRSMRDPGSRSSLWE